MDAATGKTSGLVAAASTFMEGLLALAQNRVQIFSIELQEEKLRLIKILVWLGAAVFAGMMTVAFVTITIVYAFWENARMPALIGVTVFYLVGFGAICLKLRHFVATQPKPFDATLSELEKDRACIRPKNSIG